MKKRLFKQEVSISGAGTAHEAAAVFRTSYQESKRPGVAHNSRGHSLSGPKNHGDMTPQDPQPLTTRPYMYRRFRPSSILRLAESIMVGRDGELAPIKRRWQWTRKGERARRLEGENLKLGRRDGPKAGGQAAGSVASDAKTRERPKRWTAGSQLSKRYQRQKVPGVFRSP